MSMIAGALRRLCYPLVRNSFTYFPGMVFVRLSRWFRKRSYSNERQEDFADITVYGEVKMKVMPSNYMGGSLYWGGLHHVNEIIYLDQTLKNDDVFVDIGANQGEFSLFAATKAKNGRVFSFEPVSKQLGMLKTNVRLNSFSNVEVYEYGLSNKQGILPIYTSVETDLHHGVHEGLSSLYTTDKVNKVEQEIELKVFDDEFFGKLNRLNFIKIDIEGAELFALKGMVKTIEKFKPEILIELNEETFNAAGYGINEMMDFVSKFGYRVYSINRGRLNKVDQNQISSWGNYIFKV